MTENRDERTTQRTQAVLAATQAQTTNQPAAQGAQTAQAASGEYKEYPLEFPLRLGNGSTLTSLHLRRAKYRDVRLAQREAAGDESMLQGILIAKIAQEPLTVEDVDEIDLADIGRILEPFRSALDDKAG